MVFMPIPAIHPDVSEGGMGGFIGVVSFGGVVPGGITTLKSRLRVPSFSVVSPVYRDWETDRKSTRLNSSHITRSRMPSSA